MFFEIYVSFPDFPVYPELLDPKLHPQVGLWVSDIENDNVLPVGLVAIEGIHRSIFPLLVDGESAISILDRRVGTISEGI